MSNLPPKLHAQRFHVAEARIAALRCTLRNRARTAAEWDAAVYTLERLIIAAGGSLAEACGRAAR